MWPVGHGWHGTEAWCPELMGWRSSSPQRHRKAFIRSLAMHPSTPDFDCIFQELPDWVKVTLPPPERLEGLKDALRAFQKYIEALDQDREPLDLFLIADTT